MRGVRRMLLVYALGLLAACKADLPEGVFVCERDNQCPKGQVCRSAEDDGGERYCYADSNAGTNAGSGGGNEAGMPAAGSDAAVDGGVDAGMPAAPAPGVTGFVTLGERRSGDGLTLWGDGFEVGERQCSRDGHLCVTGGLQP